MGLHCWNEVSSGRFKEEDLVDDPEGTKPIMALETSYNLRDGFIACLSKLLRAEINMVEDEEKRSLNIWLRRSPASSQIRLELDDELRQLLDVLKYSLSLIAKRRYVPKLHPVCDELWDAILIFVYSDIDHIVGSLIDLFQTKRDCYDDFVSNMMGIGAIDYSISATSRELGDQLISLHQIVQAYKGTMKEVNAIIQAASEMKRLSHHQGRLRDLLGNPDFANGLDELICRLGLPKHVYSTLVRAARTSGSFENITFHLLPYTPPKKVSFSGLDSTRSPVARQAAQHTPSSSQPQQVTSLSQPSTVKIPPATQTGEGSLLEAIRPFLAREDRKVGLLHLHPATKREAVQLVGSVLRGQILPVHSDTWYHIGFVTAKDEGEQQLLGGLYSALVKEAEDPELIFRELTQALETHTLVGLLDSKGWGHFRKVLPRLETFLKTPPDQRLTVWRLKQFVQSDETVEPPPCLQRDYGFKYCKQREEVLRMKTIYEAMIKLIDPLDIHNACVHGHLFEWARRSGVSIEFKDKRLMQNDYPSPYVGYDTEDGTAEYRRPLFKRHLKA